MTKLLIIISSFSFVNFFITTAIVKIPYSIFFITTISTGKIFSGMLVGRHLIFSSISIFDLIMTDEAILSDLFSTTAAIVATLTGLIGAFATFRLQRMDAKLDFLKDYMLHKETKSATTLNQELRNIEYQHIEKIYQHNMDAVSLLKNIVDECDYYQHSDEYYYDLRNIERHQSHYDQIKKITKRYFFLSLAFVFLSLGLLFTADIITNLSSQWVILMLFFSITGLAFYGFFAQFKMLLG